MMLETIDLQVVSMAGTTVTSTRASRATTVAEVKSLVKDTAGIPLSEQRLLDGGAMLSDETTLDQLGTDAPASKVLTLVRVKASPPVPSPDGRAAACYRPLHIQLSPSNPSNKPFFAPAFEEPSAQWRVRYMFDRGFRSGAAAATVVSFTTVGFVGGVGGGAALGLVGGCTSVLCRSCAGRPLELRWVTTDFKDAAFAGFVGGIMVPGGVVAMISMPACALVGALLGLAGDGICAFVRLSGCSSR
mmetsp:Transcript_157693/g.382885  ORF Transcript_157693/g.382885 Transcript_157693/m.382885 type:complete len:245 (+) Transcript_157693:69-803(+)